MKKINFLRIAFLVMPLFVTNISFGQILEWNFTTSTTGQETTVNATTNNTNLEMSALTRGTGAPAASTAVDKTFLSTMTSSTDKTSAITNNTYFQFTVQAKTGYYVSLTDLDASLIISSATLSAMIYQFRYSLDGTNFTDIGSPTTLTDTNVKGVFQPTIDLAQYANLKNVPSTITITFRLYAWGGTTGNFGLGYSASASVPVLSIGGVVSNAITTVSSDPKIEGWEITTILGTAATVDATSKNINLNVPVLSRGAGLTTASYNYAFVSLTPATATTTKAIAKTNNEYFQLSIPPATGFKVSLSTLKYRFRTNSSTLKYIWAYSIDGGYTFTDIGSEATCVNAAGGFDYQMDLSNIAALQNVPSSVLLRMYVWNVGANSCGFGRILNGSNVGSTVNCVYIRGKVDALPSLNPMAITVETTNNFQKRSLIENVVYYTNRVYTSYNVPSTLANYEFLSSTAGVSSDGITPTGTIIPSADGDIYVLARTSTGVSGWTLVPGTEFYYNASGTTAGISVFKKTVTAGQRVPIPAVDNFQEAKPFAKTIHFNQYFRSVGSGNWSDNTKWEISSDNLNWTSATFVPTLAASAVSIPAGQELIINAPTTASIITVNPTAKLTVNAETSFAANTLNLNSDATGTATFIDNGTSNITTANVQQYLTTGRNWYLSIPVSTAASGTLSSASSVLCWDETIGDWAAPTLSTLNPLRGYISVNTTSTGTVTFNGTLNNGEKFIDLTRTTGKTKEGFNLVGNPYPSYLNWTSALAASANTLTTIWYRTKVGTSYAFHTFNAQGGVGTPAGVTGEIPPMQAFWVRVNAGGGRLTLNNTMRSHGSGSNPLKAPAIRNDQQKLLRLQVSNGTNTDETVVYFNANASNGFDAYDSPKMSNASVAVPEIYTLAANEELVINGMNELALNTELPLGFRSGELNNYSIKASEIKNFDSDIRIILKDKIQNIEQDITDETAYDFSSDVASTENRFSIILRTAGMTTDVSNLDNQTISIFGNADKKITIRCSPELIGHGTISVYDGIGQKLENINISSTTTVSNKTYSSSVYLVCVMANGKVKTQKVMIN